MAAPRQGLNPTTHSVGITAKLVTVQAISADGLLAQTVDRQNTQTQVSMLVQRSKGPLPRPGETWLLTQDLGVWTFAAFVGKTPADFAGTAGGTQITVAASPPASPALGDLWLDAASGNEVFRWAGGAWVAAQFGTQALADHAVTAAKIASGTITSAQIAPNAGITAGQVAFTVTDIGGVRIITGTSQPSGAHIGDLWLNPANGNALSIWDGNEWVAYQFGAGAIQPGSLTSFQISPDAGISQGQVNFTARDIGGITTSVAAAQPASPMAGDLWYDATNSYVLKQWNGTAWVPYQFGTNAIQAGSITAALIAANTITAAQIAAGTITATQIAAGTIAAGMVDGTTIKGAQFLAYGANGELLIYDAPPGPPPNGANGTLIGAWSASPGSDPFNGSVPYTNGLSVGAHSAPQVLVIPGGNGAGSQIAFPFNTANQNVANQASYPSDDAGVTALLGAINNGGLVNQFLSLLIQGPINQNDPIYNGYTLQLNSAADDNSLHATATVTDAGGVVYLGFGNPGGAAPEITIGQPPPGSPPGYGSTFIPVLLNGALLTYGTTSGGTYTTTFTRSTTWTCPADVTSIKVECWGAGAGGQWASGPGGGSCEYAAEATLSVVPGTTYTITIGAGGTRGVTAHGAGGPGGNTSFSGGVAITVLAHGAPANNTNPSVGGSGSTNSVNHPGAGCNSPSGANIGGGGGAGGAGPAGPGIAGHPANGITPGNGGSSASGGGVAGGGGWGGNAPTSGGGGGLGGAGGGSGGASASAGASGGVGGNGMLRITYTQPGVTGIQASFASMAGTDGSSNAYPVGYMGQTVAVQPGSSPSVPEAWHYVNAAGQPAFGAGWSNFGHSFVGLAFRALPNGNVEFMGMITPGPANSTMFTLPSGYIPRTQQALSGDVRGGATASFTNKPGWNVLTTGAVVDNGNGWNGATAVWISGQISLSI